MCMKVVQLINNFIHLLLRHFSRDIHLQLMRFLFSLIRAILTERFISTEDGEIFTLILVEPLQEVRYGGLASSSHIINKHMKVRTLSPQIKRASPPHWHAVLQKITGGLPSQISNRTFYFCLPTVYIPYSLTLPQRTH